MTPAEAPREAATVAPTRVRRRRTVAAIAVLGIVLGIVVAALWWSGRADAPGLQPPAAPPSPAPSPAAPDPPPTPRRVLRARVVEPATAQELPQPEPPRTESPQALDWTGEVRTRSGAAVADADVALLDDQDERVDGAGTGASGEFTIEGHGMVAGTLVVRHPDFETTRAAVARATRDVTPDRITVVVGDGAAIAGDVLLPNGSVPSQTIRVAAWPVDGASFTRRLAQRATRDHPLVPATVTDTSGRFRIGGLTPGRAYHLIAGGPGYARVVGSGARPPPSIAGGDPAHVVVGPIYVLHLRVAGPDGAPLRSSPALVPWRGIVLSGSAGELDTTGPGAPATVWAEVPGADAALEHWNGRTFMLYVGADERERLGPIHVSAGAPGYRRRALDVWAVRASKAPPDGEEIRLEPAVAAWGRIRLRLDDGGTGLARALEGLADTGISSGRSVVLTPLGGGIEGTGEFRVALGRWPKDVLDLDGVPVGRWRVRLDVQFVAPSERGWVDVEVTATDPVDVVLGLRTWAAIEVAPTIGGDARTPYAGPLVVTLYRSGTNQTCMASFAGPPYRIVGVEPRAYDVHVGSVVGQGRVDRVDARRSEITPVEVRLATKEPPR